MGQSRPLASLDYAQLAIQLRALAELAKSTDARAQLTDLAARYERLSQAAAQISQKYLPMLDSGWPTGASHRGRHR